MTPVRQEVPTRAPGRSRVRYRVSAMTVLLGMITYLDRTCISVTAPNIMKDLHLTQIQMSFVFSAFTLAYALFEIPSGWWGDRVGTRRVLTRIVAWWSTFTMLTGGAWNYAALLVTRFLFGAGEAGCWPNVTRTLSRWFPLSERGKAQSFFFMGAHLAGGFTPLLVTAMLSRMSWRLLFVIFGSVGFLWAVWWRYWFRDEPSEHAAVRAGELEFIEKGRMIAAGERSDSTPWKALLANRTAVLICLMYFTQAYGFNFYVTWLPTYLKNVRGFTSVSLGVLAGLPLALSVLAGLSGGATTDWLTRRFGLRIGRATVGAAALLAAGGFMMAGTFTANPYSSAILIALGSAAANFMLPAAWGSCIDLGGRHAGTLSGAMNTSGQIGGVLSPMIVGLCVQWFGSWSAPLYLTAALYFVGAICWAGIDPSRRRV
ncbi:MAG TPA: MFS transporter [Bryobacteraceae bacterium]